MSLERPLRGARMICADCCQEVTVADWCPGWAIYVCTSCCHARQALDPCCNPNLVTRVPCSRYEDPQGALEL